MTATQRIFGLCLWSSLVLASQSAQGQVSQSGAAGQARTALSTPALRYFGRAVKTPTVRHRLHRQVTQSHSYQLAGGKPFQNLTNRPTITPYLSLDTIESSVGLPNYYSRVLPKIQQQEANEAQAAELRRLQQQVRLANAPGSISNNRNGGVPTTGGSSQFMNVGGFFPPIRR